MQCGGQLEGHVLEDSNRIRWKVALVFPSVLLGGLYPGARGNTCGIWSSGVLSVQRGPGAMVQATCSEVACLYTGIIPENLFAYLPTYLPTV